MDTTMTLGQVKALVDDHLKARGHNDKWLYDRMQLSKGSYYDMWRRGSVRVDVLTRIAAAMELTMVEFFAGPGGTTQGPAQVAEPAPKYGRLYLEQRVERLEEQVRELLRKST